MNGSEVNAVNKINAAFKNIRIMYIRVCVFSA